MPPKNVAAVPPPAADLETDEIFEEEEEGEGRAVFNFSAREVSNLPCELETTVTLGGICRENTSSAAEASSNPQAFEFPKDRFIRPLNRELYDDLVSRRLLVSLRDVGNGNAVIGEASLNCLELLHEKTEVDAILELPLKETYYDKWWPEREAAANQAAGGKDKAAGKAKAKAKAAAAPEEVEPEMPKRPPDFVPPTTCIRVRVSVGQLIGPAEDRDDWTTATIDVKGVYALPDRLSMIGLASQSDDADSHQLKYTAMLLGCPLGEGKLVNARENPPEDAPDGQMDQQAVQSAECKMRLAENYNKFVQFEKPTGKYQGHAFLRTFRRMLNTTGGAWIYFVPEEKPPLDPKKPNSPEAPELAKHFVGKAWLDLRPLIKPGVQSRESRCPLVSAADPAEHMEGEPDLQDSEAYVYVSFELRSAPVSPPEHPVEDLKTLAPVRKTPTKLPNSSESVTMYKDAVEACFLNLCRECVPTTQTSSDAVQQMKKAGVYDDLQSSLRGAVIRVFRERLRKDTNAVPGKPLEGELRDELISGTYTYLKDAAISVLEDLRQKEAGFGDVAAEGFVAAPPVETVFQDEPGRRTSVPGCVPENGFESEMMLVPACSLGSDQVRGGLDIATVLQEGPGAQRAREVLAAASDAPARNARLAFEAEFVGNWSRAAEMLQRRLVLDSVKGDPKEWIAYAKFCARARGRQSAAEESLRQAVQLLASGTTPFCPEDNVEVDMMLACLLLDRGRYQEAIAVFQEYHERDISQPMFNFFLGLALFLVNDGGDDSARLLQAVGMPKAWFQGLQSDTDVAEKLKISRGTDTINLPPYVDGLEKLLDFGLPALAFMFLDQCKLVPSGELCREPLAFIDARASALDRDWAAALSRIGKLTASAGGASQEAWRLQSECLLQLGDTDRALQSFNQAMAFDKKFEEPTVFIRLGTVLVVKKRWKQAREAYLRSIQFLPTAEAWTGVAYAEYRSDELQMCYEALCEANLLDNERPDVWALLTLVHQRLENWTQACQCFRQCLGLKPDCEELLLEVSAEFSRGSPGQGQQPSFAQAAAQRALELRKSGQAHGALAEALAVQGLGENAVNEARIAMELLVDQPETRKGVFDRALRWCDENGLPAEVILMTQQRCDQRVAKSP